MRALLCCLGLLAAGPLAVTAAPGPAKGEANTVPYFVGNCFNCHGTDGKNRGAIPALAGRDRALLEEKLKSYKAGSKPATIMHQLAKGYTDEEIAILADYFSKQK